VVGSIEGGGILLGLLIGASRIQAGGLDRPWGVQQFYVGGPADADDSDLAITTTTTSFSRVSLAAAPTAIEAEAWKLPIRSMPGRWARCVGKAGAWRASGSATTATKPVLRNLQLTSGRLAARRLGGASGSRQSTLFSLLLAFNNAQRGRWGLLDGQDLAGPARRRSARAHRLVAPAELRVLRKRWQRRSASGRPATRAGAPGSTAGQSLTSSKPCRWPTGPRIEERGSNFSRRSTARAGDCPAPCCNPPCLCSMRPLSCPLTAESESAVQQGLEQAMAWSHRAGDCPSPRHVQGADQTWCSRRWHRCAGHSPRPVDGPRRAV